MLPFLLAVAATTFPVVVGKDADGRTVSVEKITLPPLPKDATAPDAPPCIPQRYDLVHVKPGEQPGPKSERETVVTTAVDSQCSYGAAGGGEDVTVDGATLTYSIEGGSTWRWEQTKTWQLVPSLTLTEETTSGNWSLSINREDTVDDHVRDVTHVEWVLPYCVPDGKAQPTDAPTWSYDQIPLLAAGKARDVYIASGWRIEEPPRLLRVDAAATEGKQQGGFLVHGTKGNPARTSFWVTAAAPDTLIVEAQDAKVVHGARSWVYDDHFEIWATRQELSYQRGCIDRKDLQRPIQWGIRVSDGAVFAGAGAPKERPTVARLVLPAVGGRQRVRFKVKLPFVPQGVTVVYSDTDDGRTQTRLLATSDLQFKEARSLGRIEATK